jgi:hypothetical protein
MSPASRRVARIALLTIAALCASAILIMSFVGIWMDSISPSLGQNLGETGVVLVIVGLVAGGFGLGLDGKL